MEVIVQLILASFLGCLIGLEREFKRKGAGLQTYSLVGLGSSLFMIISLGLFDSFLGKTNLSFDLLRVIQAIVIGIGFIGAGVIFRQPSGTIGLTTAAGLWVTAGIGIAVGLKLYFPAIFTTLLVLLILAGLGELEKKIFKRE